MTKKDYNLIAGVLRIEYAKTDYNKIAWYEMRKKREAITSVIENISKTLEKENPRFNREKFLIACGVDIKYPCLVCDKVTDKPACDDCDKLVNTL